MTDDVRILDSASRVAGADPVAVGSFMDALTGRREPVPDERDAALLAEVLYERLGRASGGPAWADLPERAQGGNGGRRGGRLFWRWAAADVIREVVERTSR